MSLNNGIASRLDAAWGTPILYGPDGRPWQSVPDLTYKRERARRLERESALAHAVLTRSTENVIGSGITIRPKSSSPEFNKEIGALWNEWTSGKTADVRRTYSFNQLQRHAYRHGSRDGDCGFGLINRTDQGIRFPELQFIPGEQIDHSGVSGQRIVDGIEYNAVNAPVAYYIKTQSGIPQRVDARDFVFLHKTTMYNVGRGESDFDGTYRLFEQLEGHIEAVVVASRIAASNAMIAKRKNPNRALARPGTKTERADGVQVPSRIIEPGMINFIDIDEELVAFNPSQPHQRFVEFLTAICRLLGLKFGLTVERVLMDFSGASYSVSRSTAIQEMQAAWPAQEDFNASFFARIYPWFVSIMVKNGRVKTPPPEDSWAYDWVPPGRQINDIVKEAAGWELMMKLGLGAPELFATAIGEDWEKLKATIKKNKAELSDLGIPWPTDAKAAAASLLADSITPPTAANSGTNNGQETQPQP